MFVGGRERAARREGDERDGQRPLLMRHDLCGPGPHVIAVGFEPHEMGSRRHVPKHHRCRANRPSVERQSRALRNRMNRQGSERTRVRHRPARSRDAVGRLRSLAVQSRGRRFTHG